MSKCEKHGRFFQPNRDFFRPIQSDQPHIYSFIEGVRLTMRAFHSETIHNFQVNKMTICEISFWSKLEIPEPKGALGWINPLPSHTFCVWSIISFYAPAIFNGGHIVSPLSVRTSVPSVRSVPYVTLLVSVRYLLKGLVYWIEIYTQVYNHKM